MPFQKGQPSYRKGKHFSEEHRRNIGEANKGRIPWNKGKECPQHSEALRGRHLSPETEFKKGHRYWKGKHRSEETRRKIGEAQRGKRTGENNPYWKGGYEPYYGPNWEQQKRLARERDKGICYNCGVKEDGRKHDTHHIIPFRFYGLERYEEANDLENLLTLCPSCHLS